MAMAIYIINYFLPFFIKRIDIFISFQEWIEDKYIGNNGTSSFGDPALDDYIIEAKMKITSGENVSMDIRWERGSKYYSVIMNKFEVTV